MRRNFLNRFSRSRSRHLSVFDGQDLKRAMLTASAWLEQHRDAINALNVFPVPDGDTGTNMTLTMRAAIKDVADLEETSVAVVAEKLSRGALMGARGNSGVILSQILRGLSRGLEGKRNFNAAELASALQESSKMAYRAVIKPVEGTILTVIREAAEAAQVSASQGADITTLLGDTVRAAHEAVAKTPDLLPILKQAGVVDAGGQGLAIVLEGLWRYSRGESAHMSHSEISTEREEVRRGNVTVEEEFGYEVVFLLHGEQLNIEEIRDTITRMGGVSTVVAGDPTLLKVHTHTPTPGKILDYGVSLGSLDDINIENLQAQSLRYAEAAARERATAGVAANGASARESHASAPGRDLSGYGAVVAPPLAQGAPPHARTTPIATVAVVAGDGWKEVYLSLGVTALVQGGQTMNPSTQDLLDAVEHCPSDNVILLPNNGNVVLTARQVIELTQKHVYVVPSETLPQGVAALLAFNFEADFDANAHAMDSAISSVQTAEITRAVRSVQIDGISVTEGDVIGLINGHLVTSGREMNEIVHDTLNRMHTDEREIITLYFGEGVTLDDANEMARRVKEWFPGQEIEVVDGGQPYYAFIISAE